MASNERKLQTMGVNWLKLALPDIMVVAVINEIPQSGWSEEEQRINMIRMVLMKQMGLYPGCCDLFLFKQGSTPGELWVRALETKDKASQSSKQVAFQKHWESIGGIYHIWRNLTELHDLCVSWGLKPIVAPPATTPLSKKQLMGNMMHQFMLETKKD